MFYTAYSSYKLDKPLHWPLTGMMWPGSCRAERDGCFLERLEITVPLAKVKISVPNAAALQQTGRNSKHKLLWVSLWNSGTVEAWPVICFLILCLRIYNCNLFAAQITTRSSENNLCSCCVCCLSDRQRLITILSWQSLQRISRDNN